jgi:polysaccharide deacetylase family protein (PEP-CTERM system associated)
MTPDTAQGEQRMTNAFTVDVEDYFQVAAFEGHIAREDWDRHPRRVERNTEAVLNLLDAHGVKGTFFTLGWVAERCPALVRDIAARGHELASHGYDHTRVTQMNRDHFRDDVTRAKRLLEDAAGVAVRGYRAPTFSFNRDNRWAYELLLEAGYAYSSSVAPVKHDLYGIPDAPREPYRDASGMLEIPISTIRIGARNLPCGGGGFFRLYPYRLTRWCIERINREDAQPCIFYMHPWEIDVEQPRQTGVGFKTRLRHYLNLSRVESRLQRLLTDFRWARMDEVYAT